MPFPQQFTSLLLLMFSAGFTLSIYLPFIPFIYWMTGIGNWIVSVLVGCAAGPLWGPHIWVRLRTEVVEQHMVTSTLSIP